LSTVTSAEQILVLHAGKVAEAGTHQELLAMKGRYASMWKKQIRAERAAEAASQMVAKANALQKAALERPGSSGNEGGPSEDVSENEAESRRLGVASRPLIHSTAGRQDSSSSTSRSQADDTLEDDRADEGKAPQVPDAADRPGKPDGDAENLQRTGDGEASRT
jgi:hypothetical protein